MDNKLIFVLYRDGMEVARGSNELSAVKYIHNHHSFSLQWAIRYEGYRLVVENEQGDKLYGLCSDGRYIKIDRTQMSTTNI